MNDRIVGKPRIQTYAAYIDYFKHLRQQYFEQLPIGEKSLIGYRDVLQSPLQPLMDNLESNVYETFEKDNPKYLHYEYAMERALFDITKKLSKDQSIVILVVGAGRGPLVRAALLAR